MKSWHLTRPTSLCILLKYPTWLSEVKFSPAGLIFFQVIFRSGKRSRTARPIVEIEAVAMNCASIGLHFISSWTKSSSDSASLFGWPLAAAWRRRFSPVWQKVFYTFETVTPLTLYFDPVTRKLLGSWVVFCWNVPASTQNIINNRWPHILFNWFSHGGTFFRTHSLRSKVFLPAKRNMSRDQSERSKWSREQAQNLILHIVSHN